MPPFDGPRATLCVTRYPWKTRVVPSSIATGTETTSAFLHSCKTLTRFGSIANVSATRRSCCFAMSYGFSRRWETGASTVVTCTPLAAQMGRFLPGRRTLLDREGHRPNGRTAPVGGIGDQLERVVTRWKEGPRRVATGHAVRIPARQHVAHASEQPDASAGRAPQLEVELLHGLDVLTRVRSRYRARDEAQQRRLRVRRLERARRKTHVVQRSVLGRAERDHPGNADLVPRFGLDDEISLDRCVAVDRARHARRQMEVDRATGTEEELLRTDPEVDRGRAFARDLDVE